MLRVIVYALQSPGVGTLNVRILNGLEIEMRGAANLPKITAREFSGPYYYY